MSELINLSWSLFQMVGWMFENALAAIQSPPSIPFTILLSTDCLRLGDIHFAKIQMTLGMWTVSITVLERWVESRRFNPECMSADDCSCSNAILIVLTPNKQGTALMYASVGLIVWQCKGPVGQIEDIPKLIMYAHSQLGEDRPSSPNTCKTYCIIIGDYGGSMGFATELPFCTAYPLSFADRDDPTQMNFRHPQNHPCSFTADVLLVCQLHEIVLHVNMRGTDIIGTSSFLGVYISQPTSFHRLLLLKVMWHPSPTHSWELCLHFSTWVRSPAQTHYSPAQLGI